ncbi:MAG: hypothetical protein RBS22_04935 [Spongiibacteraceae bacterium]|nr:hypothetical protein [Spongiibacteraceae bacterium]
MAVRGSRQVESVVVTVDRRRQRLLRLLGAAAVLLAVVASYMAGYWSAADGYQDMSADYRQQRKSLEAGAEREQELRRALVNAQVAAEVDRQSVETLRQLLKEQQKKLAGLTQENAFYKGLMAPTEREQGLSIRSFELYPGAAPGRVAYKLIVQQLASKHVLLRGHITVDVVGNGPQGEQRIALHTLSEQVEGANITMRFKYFQTLEGELVLPAGFRPQRVEVEAIASKPKYVKVDKQFGWVIQEG